MINRKISDLFKMEVNSNNDGSIIIPPSVFIRNKNAINEIKTLIREEANRVGKPFYFSTVSIREGVYVSWSTEYRDCLPDLAFEEELLGDGLVYIVRKVG